MLLSARMAQVPAALIAHAYELQEAGYYLAGGELTLRRKVMDVAARLEPGDAQRILLSHIHFAVETMRATLTLSMNDNRQITWNLELPS